MEGQRGQDGAGGCPRTFALACQLGLEFRQRVSFGHVWVEGMGGE